MSLILSIIFMLMGDRALDVLHVALSTQLLYFFLIRFGSFDALYLDFTPWSFQLQITISVFVSVGVQFLYTLRLWKFGRHFHRFVPWFTFMAVAASLGAGIFFIYDTYNAPAGVWMDDLVKKRSTCTFFATLALSDFVIAICMCYYLYQSKAATGFSTTASMLLGLMRLILVSGIATSLCSLLVLITYTASPYSLFYLAVDFILPKLYINSFLAMLNRRQEHQANKSPSQYEGHLNPPVVHISRTTESSIEGTNINIPLEEIQHSHSSDELDRPKRTLTCEV
ncbi:uncharacterized protein EV420DRAFT_1768012 [Desarmillaria tabescens]|uniref:DUF6534 domain-containing protein n=1 Tax=Armillaria tabescens TaxID=1929756 RepID=A0AA39JSA3_ARMTA|nr:uncharacterized protein EV420DRAFT_1768012 [Desarmillaria tabescens]KAK0445648.1 hypothetical protein EV420DRAFT_1768012 [Desarmillaria tabescens]